MLNIRTLLPILLLAAIATIAARSSHAADITTYDLDSLCYMSTDVVEATIVKSPDAEQPRWATVYTATVTDSIEGQCHIGDKIANLGLDLYNPSIEGQLCILFLTRYQYQLHLQKREPIAPQAVDMLLIDSHTHVRRYFQWMNPGGMVAEGYMQSWRGSAVPATDTATGENLFPTLAEERKDIVTKWAAVDRLRPLLAHIPTPVDVPILLGLLRDRQRRPAPRDYHENRLVDGLAEAICARLGSLYDPAISLDAIAANKDWQVAEDSGLDWGAFTGEEGLGYARKMLVNQTERVDRRLAAFEVLDSADRDMRVARATVNADRDAIVAVGTSDDTPEVLRVAIIPRLDITVQSTADVLRLSYHRVMSDEVQFAIEALFDDAARKCDGPLYDSLNATSGPVISIVRLSPSLPAKSGFIALQFEMIQTKASEGVNFTRDYVLTNLATQVVYPTDLREHGVITHNFQDMQLPLPNDLPPGTYRIALEFRANGKVVSVGHGVTFHLTAGPVH